MSAMARAPGKSGRTAYFRLGVRLAAASVFVWGCSSVVLVGHGSASNDTRVTQPVAARPAHPEKAHARPGATAPPSAAASAPLPSPPLSIEPTTERAGASSPQSGVASGEREAAEQRKPAGPSASVAGLKILGSVPIATSSRALRRLIGGALDAGQGIPNCDRSESPRNCDPQAQRGWRALIAETRQLAMPVRMARINAEVNARIAYVTDQVAHGVPDRWSSATDTMARGAGDCEDFAILKMWLLAESGMPLENMFIMVVRSSRLSTEHAVLAVKHEGETYILDNLARVVKPAHEFAHYAPIFSANLGGLWLHAFPSRVDVAAVAR